MRWPALEIRSSGAADECGSGEKADHESEGVVDVSQLVEAEQALGLAETVRIDGSDLFHEDARPLPADHDFRPERRRSCACGRRGDNDCREREQLVRLNHDAVPAPPLLVAAGCARRPQGEDLTPLHEAIP